MKSLRMAALAALTFYCALILASAADTHTYTSNHTKVDAYHSRASDNSRNYTSHVAESTPPGNLDVTVENRQPIALYAYMTGVINGSHHLLTAANGTFQWKAKPDGDSKCAATPCYFTADDSSYHIRLASSADTSLAIPGYAGSGRLYVSEQQLAFGTYQGGPAEGFAEPSPTNPSLNASDFRWQFVEFTYGADDFYVNLSNMDWVSLALGISVTSSTTSTTTSTPGLRGAGAVQSICAELKAQAAADGFEWDRLCVYSSTNGSDLVRVLSPDQYLSLHPTANLSTYYDSYVDRVWDRYSAQNLTINTQDSWSLARNGSRTAYGKNVTCAVVDERNRSASLWCHDAQTGRDYEFARPSTPEIMGCAQKPGGMFEVSGGGGGDWTQAEIVPRLCAAFVRSTLLLDDGDVQPNAAIDAARYYTDGTTNHYARLVHKYQRLGMGYAFAYDDTNPIGQGLSNTTTNAAGVISDPSPVALRVTVM